MSGWHLTLKRAPTLRLDLRRVSPLALAALDAAGVAGVDVWHGNERCALADWFEIEAIDTDGELLVAGDLSRCDRLGQAMAGGRLEVEGSVGDWFAAGLSGGAVHLCGNAGRMAACAMRGGELGVQGDVGDFGCGALPGDLDGLRGGTVIVHGSVGARFADRMRRGTVLIGGDAGDFLASRMVAGTIALAGRCGLHPGYMQRRGSLVLAGPAPATPASLVPARGEAAVAWQLLAREIARLAHHHGLDEAFAALPARRPARLLGDLAVDGRGEWWLAGTARDT
jgi:formylmethanofuran dehydrogenase subunit C